jgi:hypothetical protein
MLDPFFNEMLKRVRDRILRLQRMEALILLEMDEPAPPSMPQPKSAPPADLPSRSEPAPDPRPRRVAFGGSGRKAGPLRGWVAELLVDRGPLTVPEILILKPELDKRQVYNLVTSCPWFERVPDLFPATYQLSTKGREEYAKAKAEGQHE